MVDVSPDFRQQFIDGDLSIPDVLCVTHAHNDHIAGLGDLADLCYWQESKLTVISPDVTDILKQRFPYLTPDRNIFFTALQQVEVEDVHISFHRVNHGNNGYSYGIRFSNQTNNWAYISDVIHMTYEQMKPFYQLALLILGASYLDASNYPFQYNRSIYDVKEALLLRKEMQPEKMILTHMSHNIDITKNILPEGVWFGKDGMCITI